MISWTIAILFSVSSIAFCAIMLDMFLKRRKP